MNCVLGFSSYTPSTDQFLWRTIRRPFFRWRFRLVSSWIQGLSFDKFKALFETVEYFSRLCNDFCLSLNKFFSSLFQKGSTYLKVQILLFWGMIRVRDFKVWRFASEWKYCQLFSKHYLYYSGYIQCIANYWIFINNNKIISM